MAETFRPPQGVRDEAARALAWIADGKAGPGFTDTGRARAAQLARGDAVSAETILRMYSLLVMKATSRGRVSRLGMKAIQVQVELLGLLGVAMPGSLGHHKLENNCLLVQRYWKAKAWNLATSRKPKQFRTCPRN